MQESAKAGKAPAPYAGYDVLAKWNTPSFNDRTREVLAQRLSEVPPRCFLAQLPVRLLEFLKALGLNCDQARRFVQ